MNLENTKYTRPVASIDDTSAITISAALNNLLANEYALFTKTLNYHWNITGPRFLSLHKFLEEHYHSLLTVMDNIAERVRILGERPHSTVKKFSEEMDLKEKNGKDMSSSEMLLDLFNDNLKIQAFIKETTSDDALLKQDPGTEDFLVGLLQKHEKMSWMLKSHLD